MEDFRKLLDYFIMEAEKLTKILLFNIDIGVDLSSVKDDLANLERGYSFIRHPSNHRLDAMFKTVLVEACTCHNIGLSRDGQWNRSAITSYLRNTVVLEEMILGGIYIACGQLPRATELLSLETENSPSATRGIFIWNGYMIYIIRHHKSKRVTNREFYVVRFLPARLGMVLLKYLIIIRRLATLLRREQIGYPNLEQHNCQSQFLFQTYDKPWTSNRLTRVLKIATLHVWQ
ncbi:hypothetical protein BGZ63DRAFT_409504 [Mariannaea sp. PMI_226]|nr:hypothetical protein BGZ63DRAFT_409504 [Mariannaea sp. PMI_226]